MKVKPLFCIFIALAGLLACHTDRSSKKKVFSYNESSNIASLDPAFAKNQSIIWAVHQIYNTLVETDSQLNMVPSLARRWEVSDDRMRYTFFLRQDVFFHDNDAFEKGRGRRMTAHDVVYSFKRITDVRIASSGAWIFNSRVNAETGFTALNDSVFQLQLLQPFTPVLGLLSMQYCSIVPYEVVDKYRQDFRSHPCGTGPFVFKSWEEGQAMVLLKNEHYFEYDSSGIRLPYIDAIKISLYTSKATEFLLFRQGRLDFINDIDASFKDEVLTKTGILKKEWESKVVLSKHPYLNTEYLGILLSDHSAGNPLQNKRIRLAINYGFDRRKLIMYLRNSIGTPAESGFIPAGLPSFDSVLVRGYQYDPVKARKLLKDAGFENGIGLPPIKLLTIAIYSELAGFIAKELEQIGIIVEVEVVQKSLLLAQTAKSQAPFFRASWIADYPDAENYLSVFYSKNPAPPNYTRYHNEAFDKLYDSALTIADDSSRYVVYRKMDRMILEDAPIVPLWYDEVIRLVQPRVSGFHPNGLNLLELRYVHLN